MVISVQKTDPNYPTRLLERFGNATPPSFTAIGNLDLLPTNKIGFFCSARCPGNVILPTYDQAARWRDTEQCIISGFHSPVEKECLRILLRGKSPVVVCPARALPTRIPNEWRGALDSGRMLILSCFEGTAKRVTTELAIRRNEFVAALADDVFFAHISANGRSERLMAKLRTWNVPFSTIV